jgi:hypothetical protein
MKEAQKKSAPLFLFLLYFVGDFCLSVRVSNNPNPKSHTMKATEIKENIIRLAQAEVAAGSKLGEEIDYYLGVQKENEEYSGKPDYPDAVFEALRFAEGNDDHSMLRAVRKFLIAAGDYRVMPQDEIDRTTVTSGLKWHFKMAGVAYTSDYASYQICEA